MPALCLRPLAGKSSLVLARPLREFDPLGKLGAQA